MSNPTVNEISGSKHENKNNTNEHTNDNCTENKTAEDTLPDNIFKIIVKRDDNVCIKVDSRQALSTVLKDNIVIDVNDKNVPSISTKKSKRFENVLGDGHRKPQRVKHKIKSNHRRKSKNWALFFYSFSDDDDDDEDKYEYMDKDEFDDEDYDEILDYDPNPRNTYVRIVMSIVGTMLTSTAIFLTVVYNVPIVFKVFDNPSLVLKIGAFGGLLFVYFTMLCMNCGRKNPCGYILLILTTIFASIVAAIITCSYNAQVVIHGFVSASAVVLLCVGLACTSFDFTSFWLYLVVISTGFTVVAMIIVVGIMVTKVPVKIIHMAVLAGSTFLHSLALIMELQMILGGKSIEVDEHSYAIGAFMLYTSTIDIFAKILHISGLSSG